MSTVKLFLFSAACGAIALAVAQVYSYYLMPVPHRVIGPALAITAFFLARQWPTRWFLISIAVVLPFVAVAPYSIWVLGQTVAAMDMTISMADYAVMLSPILTGLVGGLLGRYFARRPINKEHSQ